MVLYALWRLITYFIPVDTLLKIILGLVVVGTLLHISGIITIDAYVVQIIDAIVSFFTVIWDYIISIIVDAVMNEIGL